MRNIVLAEVMLTTTVTHDWRDKGVFEKGVQMKVAKSAVSAIQGLAKSTGDKTRPLFINLSVLTVQRQKKSILEKSELWNMSLRDRPGDANEVGVGPASAEVTRLWKTIVDSRAEVQRKNDSAKAKSEEEKRERRDRTNLALVRATKRQRVPQSNDLEEEQSSKCGTDGTQAGEDTPAVSCATTITWQKAP